MSKSVTIGLDNSLSPEVELLGDWDKAQALLKTQLPLAVRIGAEKGRLSAAEKIKDLVRRNIRNNGPAGHHWAPYSAKYAKRKAKLGGNVDRMLRLTDTYYNNIKVIRKGTSVFVGVPKGVKSRVNKKRMEVGTIARILEKGSEAHNIQARPLWRPSFNEFGGKKRIAYHIVFNIRRTIYLMTGVRAKISL
jgi:hypothetical protein